MAHKAYGKREELSPELYYTVNCTPPKKYDSSK